MSLGLRALPFHQGMPKAIQKNAFNFHMGPLMGLGAWGRPKTGHKTKSHMNSKGLKSKKAYHAKKIKKENG